jgi:hypothetical protein
VARPRAAGELQRPAGFDGHRSLPQHGQRPVRALHPSQEHGHRGDTRWLSSDTRHGVGFDEQLASVGDLATFTCHQQFIQDKVRNKWPSGTYTVTIDAVNEVGDRGTATVSMDDQLIRPDRRIIRARRRTTRWGEDGAR